MSKTRITTQAKFTGSILGNKGAVRAYNSDVLPLLFDPYAAYVFGVDLTATPLADLTQQGRTLTLRGSPTFGAKGATVEQNDNFETPFSTLNLTGGKGATIVGVARASSLAGWMLASSYDGTNDGDLWFGLPSNAVASAQMMPSTGVTIATNLATSAPFGDDQRGTRWAFYAASYSPAGIVIGERHPVHQPRWNSIAVDATPAALGNSSKLRIGGAISSVYGTNPGEIATLAVYNSVLNQDRMMAVYAAWQTYLAAKGVAI